ncbi:GAF domain-containing protein [Methylobacterium sp. J-070]|uniref:GAF domain-containing protein n=1 Tax=Methylobacterium sp. J-070 TaxID=2836650 RepID=UPI001FBB49A5|nr:GAF domain-containing protein [Methylobacterium sp. J-070]MCJ2053461.1 GAF domain-containing protein [Methylobacterium sp. J-070]
MADTLLRPDLGVAQAAGDLAAAGSLDAIVSILRRTARAIVGADGISVILREGDASYYVAEDAIEPLWRGRRFPLTTCISGWAMLNGETVVVPDIECDDRVPTALYRVTSMRSLVMVPIGSPEAVAALGAYWCTSVIPDDATICRLEALAQRAAAALARVQVPTGASQVRDATPPAGA